MIGDKSYYAILQVAEDASVEAIEAAFRRLSAFYAPGVSMAADARIRLRELREAYEVLRRPDLRLAYDARLRRRAALMAADDSSELLPAETFSATSLPVEPRQGSQPAERLKPTQSSSHLAWLVYCRRSGDAITFKIAKILAPHTVLSTLKMQVPASDRRYDPATQEWMVSAAYEHVLRELFLNYDSVLASQRMAVPQARYPALQKISTAPEAAPLPAHKPYTRARRAASTFAPRIAWSPILITVLLAALLYNLLILTGSIDRPQPNVVSTMPTVQPQLTPIVLPTGTPTPVIYLAETRYQSVHLRAGPAESYPSLGYLFLGSSYTFTGRTADSSWLLVATDVLTGWSATWTIAITEDLTLLPVPFGQPSIDLLPGP